VVEASLSLSVRQPDAAVRENGTSRAQARPPIVCPRRNNACTPGDYRLKLLKTNDAARRKAETFDFKVYTRFNGLGERQVAPVTLPRLGFMAVATIRKKSPNKFSECGPSAQAVMLGKQSLVPSHSKHGNRKRLQDLKREAMRAWRRFVICANLLPPNQASTLWQAVSDEVATRAPNKRLPSTRVALPACVQLPSVRTLAALAEDQEPERRQR
jgi:hypothetical protein